jgi:hypothetical protein
MKPYAYPTWHPRTPPDALICSLRWRNPCKWRRARPSHINLREQRSLRERIEHHVIEGNRDRRVVVAADSRVVVGVATKGQSSSVQLSGLLHGYLGLLVSFGVQLVLPWVGAKYLVDVPSRDAELPPPRILYQNGPLLYGRQIPTRPKA